MRALLPIAILALLPTPPGFAGEATPPSFHAAKASNQDRWFISLSINSDIRYWKRDGEPNPFGTNSVELGPTAIAEYWALADWQSVDGKKHGQVFLSTKGCQVWQVQQVSVGRRLTTKEVNTVYMLPPRLGAELMDELGGLESQHIAYMKPVMGDTC